MIDGMLRTCSGYEEEGWVKMEEGILFPFQVLLFPLLLGTLQNPYNTIRQFEAGLSNQILTSSGKKVIGGSQKLSSTKPKPTKSMQCKNQAATANHTGTGHKTKLVSIIKQWWKKISHSPLRFQCGSCLWRSFQTPALLALLFVKVELSL